jgi:periplasmic protein CpxP/Spy
MMKTIHTLVTASLAGIALVAAVASAQPFGMGPGAGAGFGPAMRMGAGHGPMAGVDPATTIDFRLSDLKAQLKITTEQEAAWQAYADAAKQQATDMQALREQMHPGTGSAPDRMAQHTQIMQQRAASMATMSKAFNALYAVLTPEQKTIADQHFGPMAHRGPAFARHAG